MKLKFKKYKHSIKHLLAIKENDKKIQKKEIKYKVAVELSKTFQLRKKPKTPIKKQIIDKKTKSIWKMKIS